MIFPLIVFVSFTFSSNATLYQERELSNYTAACPHGGIFDATKSYCCPEYCGTCGGNKCHERVGGAAECCTSQIRKSCGKKKLPCKIEEETAIELPSKPHKQQTCPHGSILDSTETYCCPKACGKCGGKECHRRPGGAKHCCIDKIKRSCDKNKSPCKIIGYEAEELTEKPTESPTIKPTEIIYEKYCPENSLVDGTGKFCCPATCGKCGGYGCHLVYGGEANCCTNTFTNSCFDHEPPCKLAKSSLTEPPAVPATEPLSMIPTEKPFEKPTELPTVISTEKPSEEPTENRTEKPSEKPTKKPADMSTEEPTEISTEEPTEISTEELTEISTKEPTEMPTEEPTVLPKDEPTTEPTERSVERSTEKPTKKPTEKFDENFTEKPTENVTENPTTKPTRPVQENNCPESSLIDETGLFCCPYTCGQCGVCDRQLETESDANCCTNEIENTCTDHEPPCRLAKSDYYK